MSAGGREASSGLRDMAASVVTRVVPAPNVRCVVSRTLPGPGGTTNDDHAHQHHNHQILVFCAEGVCPLLGARDVSGANSTSRTNANGAGPRLGQPLSITGAVASHISRVRDAACEAGSGLVVCAAPKALLALDCCGGSPQKVPAAAEASRLSGHLKGWFNSSSSSDGVGDAVRYSSLRRIAAGPPGFLYIMDELGTSLEDVYVRQVRFLGGACGAATLMLGDGPFTYDAAADALLYVSDRRTINRVMPRGGLEPVAGHEGGMPADGGGGGAATGGGAAVSCRATHRVDGPPGRARFVSIADVAADDRGNVFILDDGALRVMHWPDGHVSTLVPELIGDRRRTAEARLAALPGGRLAVWGFSARHMLLMQLQLPPTSAAAAAPPPRSPLRQRQQQLSGSPQHSPQRRQPSALQHAAAAPPPPSPPLSARRSRYSSAAGGGLPAEDAAAAAAAATDAPPDVIIIAGDGVSSFPAHRAVLSARCPYFRQLLANAGGGGGNAAVASQLDSFFHDCGSSGSSVVGGRSDGGSGAAASTLEVSLRGTDPDALSVVLRHIYTGSVDHLLTPLAPAAAAAAPPLPSTHGSSEPLRAVATLADRMLLPRLADRAQELLLRGVDPSTAVSELLWAERAGLQPLLGRLEEYFVAHAAVVARRAPESLDALLEGGSREMVKRLLLARRTCGTGAGPAVAGGDQNRC